jgi:hypothetical protein
MGARRQRQQQESLWLPHPELAANGERIRDAARIIEPQQRFRF